MQWWSNTKATQLMLLDSLPQKKKIPALFVTKKLNTRSKHLNKKKIKKRLNTKIQKKHPPFKENQQSQFTLNQCSNAYTIWKNWNRTATTNTCLKALQLEHSEKKSKVKWKRLQIKKKLTIWKYKEEKKMDPLIK